MMTDLRALFAATLASAILLWAVFVNGAIAAETGLPHAVISALDVRSVPHESLSAYIEDVDTGEVLLSWHADRPRNPASTIKLLTTLVALDRLGPAYRWKTEVYASGEVVDGRLDGDLLLKGYGDPFLVTERVWQLLREIRRAGVREVTGDLSIDDSYFDVGEHDPAAFDSQPLRAYNVAPNALLMNFKVVRYWFETDYEDDSVSVQVDPPLDNLRVENRIGLVPGRCQGYQRGIAITANAAADTVTFSGKFPRGCRRYAMDRTALSHNAFVYGVFRSLWRESGGTLDGGWKNAIVEPEAEPLLSFDSLPLSEIIARVNKHSNNVMARQLLYTLSAELLGPPGTEEGGRHVIDEWLKDRGLEPGELVIENGAGLSRSARATAADIGALLSFAWRQPYMPEFVASMALSGLDGTLRHRFRNNGLTGRAHLKTGSMDDVTALAGYVQSRSGRRFALAALQNHANVHRGPGEEVQEALLRWLYEQ